MNKDLFKQMNEKKGCPFGCKKFSETLLVKRENRNMINPKYAYHMKETHGMPPSVFVESVATTLYEDDPVKANDMIDTYSFID